MILLNLVHVALESLTCIYTNNFCVQLKVWVRISKLFASVYKTASWHTTSSSEGEGAFFSAMCWDGENRADLIESATPCHTAQVVGPYRDSSPVCLIVMAAMPEDYTTAPQHLQCINKH